MSRSHTPAWSLLKPRNQIRRSVEGISEETRSSFEVWLNFGGIYEAKRRV